MASWTLNTAFPYLLLFSQFGHTNAVRTRPDNFTTTPQYINTGALNLAGNNNTSRSVAAVTTERPGTESRPHGDVTLNSVVNPAIAAAGICGNLVCLLVWNRAPDFNPTVFLIKGLAVSDTAFLAFKYIDWFGTSPENSAIYYIKWILQVYSAIAITNTTLVLVVTRWVAVHRPMTVTALLSRRRVVAVYCSVHMLGVLATLLSLISFEDVHVIIAVISVVLVALPVVVILCLNVSLVSKVWVHRANSSLGQQQQQQQAQAARSSRLNRLVVAVVCLSVTTVLAYPLPTVYLVAFAFTPEMANNGAWNPFVTGEADLLQVFNSSVNVVYYLLFASQFRQLLRSGVRCCRCVRARPYAVST